MNICVFLIQTSWSSNFVCLYQNHIHQNFFNVLAVILCLADLLINNSSNCFLVNGGEEYIGCNNLSRSEVYKWLSWMRTKSGFQDYRYLSYTHTDNPSIQGVWSPFTHRDPADNIAEFPLVCINCWLYLICADMCFIDSFTICFLDFLLQYGWWFTGWANKREQIWTVIRLLL